MLVYFTAEFTAGLKINGVFKDVIDSELKPFDLDLESFVEVCPIGYGELPINFIFNKEFCLSPDKSVTVTDLNGEYVIKFSAHFNCPLKVVLQENFNDALVTAYLENGFNVSIETANDFYIENLPLLTEQVVIEKHYLENAELVSVFLPEKSLLLVYLLAEKIVCVYKNYVKDYSFEAGFTTTEEFEDMARHTRITEWQLENYTLKAARFTVEKSKDFDENTLIKEVLPFAFLEELLLSGGGAEYLTDNLKEKQKLLKDYLGEYIGVTVPKKSEGLKVGLIYKVKDNLFKIKYCSFEFEGRLISNVKLLG